MDSSQDQIQTLAKLFVGASSPEELLIFEEVFIEIDKKAIKKSSSALGSGIGEAWGFSQLMTPTAILVATWIVKDILGKATADVAVAKIKAVFEKFLKKSSTPLTPNLILSDEEVQILRNAIENAARRHGASSERIQRLSEGILKLAKEA